MVNKNNTNMSITQFIGEILRPGAIGVNSGGNQNIAIRQGEDGVYEVFSLSSIDWQRQADSYAHLFNDPIGREEEERKRFPEDIIVLDFKASDSLIENMDMKATFDPIVARAFKDASIEFTGDSDALINFLSYKDVAPELQKYFEENYEDYDKNAIKIDPVTKEVTLDQSFFLKESGAGANSAVISTVTKFLQSNPQRLNSMRLLQQAAGSGQTTTEDGAINSGNYATKLLSDHMRKTTVTIHGTTNIAPLQKIIIKGVMPNLEGMYLITNTRESITPQGFQTILEGSLMRPPSANARGEDDQHVPAESSQPDTDFPVDGEN
jgi:hypothetical protein